MSLSEAMEEAFLLGSDGESIFFVGDFPIFPSPLPLPSDGDLAPFFVGFGDGDVVVRIFLGFLLLADNISD